MRKLWGSIYYNEKRNHWAVKGIWQRNRLYLSQIPALSDFMTCQTEEMAKYLQLEISKEIDRGSFNPARYKINRPLHLKSYAEKWLHELKKPPAIAYSTWRGYRTHLESWIIPNLGEVYLPDLNYEDLVLFFNSVDRSAKYKKNLQGTLRAMLSDAKETGYLKALPKKIQFDIPKKTIKWLTKKVQQQILAEIPEEHRAIFLFMMLTGVRPSEARALRKVDIKADEILIAKTFSPSKSGGEFIKEVKNKKEEAIPLYNAVRILLDQLPKTLSLFVFVNKSTGKPYSRKMNEAYWNPACKKVLGYVFPLNNAGRHSFANQLLEGGADLNTVSALLRHSDVGITKSNYAKPHLNVMKDVVDNVQKLR